MAALWISPPTPSTSGMQRTRRKCATGKDYSTNDYKEDRRILDRDCPREVIAATRRKPKKISTTEGISTSMPTVDTFVLENLRIQFENKESQRIKDSGVQTDDNHIFRASEYNGIPNLAVEELDIKKQYSPSPCQLNTPLNFFCPPSQCKRMLLFFVAFLLLPAIQYYLWSVHWTLRDRKIRAFSSCLITGTLATNMVFLRMLAATFDFSNNLCGTIMTEGLTDNVPGWRSDDYGYPQVFE